MNFYSSDIRAVSVARETGPHWFLLACGQGHFAFVITLFFCWMSIRPRGRRLIKAQCPKNVRWTNIYYFSCCPPESAGPKISYMRCPQKNRGGGGRDRENTSNRMGRWEEEKEDAQHKIERKKRRKGCNRYAPHCSVCTASQRTLMQRLMLRYSEVPKVIAPPIYCVCVC